MKLVYNSLFYKVVSVIRFFLLRIRYLNRFRVDKMSMIGRRCGIYIRDKGSIRCNGRMILNDDVMLYTEGILRLGDKFGINSYSRIVAHESITIGNHVTIGQMVAILDHDHDFAIKGDNLELEGYRTAPVSIGSNIWIGDKVTVLKGVSIGDNVVIGANTLVNKDVPSNCVIGGFPFRILKKL